MAGNQQEPLNLTFTNRTDLSLTVSVIISDFPIKTEIHQFTLCQNETHTLSIPRTGPNRYQARIIAADIKNPDKTIYLQTQWLTTDSATLPVTFEKPSASNTKTAGSSTVPAGSSSAPGSAKEGTHLRRLPSGRVVMETTAGSARELMQSRMDERKKRPPQRPPHWRRAML